MAIRDLARAAYAHYVERVGREPGPMTDNYEDRVAVDECWVATETGETEQAQPSQDRLVGYLVLRLEPDHLLLDNVAVAPDRQGKGIGAFLLNLAETRAVAHGRAQIRLYTHVTMVENIARYGRHGYVETHREDEHGFRRVFMLKQLDGAQD